MNDFSSELGRRLEEIQARDLYRELRRIDSAQGPQVETGIERLLNFSSNDYLGFANHPLLKEAATKAVERFGAGCGASRLISGSLAPHHELEEALAAFKRTEAALSFSSGYMASVGTICALVGKDDVIVIDRLVHASIIDAARLSGARIRVYPHNDLNALEKVLRLSAGQGSGAGESRPHILVVTESVFSMDGDQAPLREIVALKERYGAWLMVDEAHATGILGPNRRGLAESMQVADEIEIQMGTLGKALGAQGGYICGHKSLIEFLINRARTFIFSTAPVPAAAAAAKAGIELVQSAHGQTRSCRLWELVHLACDGLRDSGWKIPPPQSAIIPLMIGNEALAMSAARNLRKQGIFIPAIRYPSVRRGHARLRLTLTADHTPENVRALLQAIGRISKHGVPPLRGKAHADESGPGKLGRGMQSGNAAS